MKIKTRAITASAASAAVIFVVTYLIRIPVPGSSGGYLNIGDIAIYLSAFVLGPIPAAVAAAAGSAVSDALAGAVVYVPATFVIKGLMGLICGRLARSGRFAPFTAGAVISGAVMAAGYFAFETAVFGAAYAVTSVIPNIIQWGVCAAAAAALYPGAAKLTDQIGSAKNRK